MLACQLYQTEGRLSLQTGHSHQNLQSEERKNGGKKKSLRHCTVNRLKAVDTIGNYSK